MCSIQNIDAIRDQALQAFNNSLIYKNIVCFGPCIIFRGKIFAK